MTGAVINPEGEPFYFHRLPEAIVALNIYRQADMWQIVDDFLSNIQWKELIPWLAVTALAVLILMMQILQFIMLRKWKSAFRKGEQLSYLFQIQIRDDLNQLEKGIRRVGNELTTFSSVLADLDSHSFSGPSGQNSGTESDQSEHEADQAEQSLVEERIDIVTGDDKVSIKRSLHSDFFYLVKEQGLCLLKLKDQLLDRTPQPQYDTVIKRYFEFVDHGTGKYKLHAPAEVIWDEQTQTGEVVQKGEIWV